MGNGITPEPWTTSIEFTVTLTEMRDTQRAEFDRWLAAHDATVAAQAVTAERAKVVAWLDGQSFGKRLLAIKDPVTPIEYNQSATNMGAAEALKQASRAIQAGAHDGGAES